MALDRHQPSESPLRAALAPWFRHASGWLVLACIGIAAFGALRGYEALAADGMLVSLALTAAASIAAGIVVWRASQLQDLTPSRRAAWRWLVIAIGLELAGLLTGAMASVIPVSALPVVAGWLHAAFIPCAVIAAAG